MALPTGVSCHSTPRRRDLAIGRHHPVVLHHFGLYLAVACLMSVPLRAWLVPQCHQAASASVTGTCNTQSIGLNCLDLRVARAGALAVCLLVALIARDRKRLAKVESRLSSLESQLGRHQSVTTQPCVDRRIAGMPLAMTLQAHASSDLPRVTHEEAQKKFPLINQAGNFTERLCHFLAAWENERIRREQPLLHHYALKAPPAQREEEPRTLSHNSYRFVITRGLPDPCSDNAMLEPPQTCCSCRAVRRFGADRFLYVSGELQRCSAELIGKPLQLCGRVWRPLFWRIEAGHIVYFAEGAAAEEAVLAGELPFVSVRHLLDMLVPTSANADMTVLKYNSRLQLSFSATRCTGEYAFQETDDILSSSGSCLSDGCGLISPLAATLVQDALGLESLPAAFQGRAGPYKGLWVVDHRPASWGGHGLTSAELLMRTSQRKYIDPQAGKTVEFEVLTYSRDSGSSCLNHEVLQALSARGVPLELFEQLVAEAAADLQKVADSEASLQDFLSHPSMHGPFLKELEQMFEAQMPWEEARYTELRRQCVTYQLRQMKDRIRLPLQQSRRVLIAPDFSRKVPAGYCVLQLRQWSSPAAAAREVMVLRNPCYDPQCVLKLQVMQSIPEELAHIYDVCVLSTAPEEVVSAADVMQGDYDGDEALVIWDSRLVSYASTALPPSRDCTMEASCQSQRRVADADPDTLAAIFDSLPGVQKEHARFTAACLERTAEVERCAGEFSSRAHRLAHLCTIGVDCPTRGSHVPDFDETFDRPHWRLPRSSARFTSFRAETACGLVYDYCEAKRTGTISESFLDEERLMLRSFPETTLQRAIEDVLSVLVQLSSAMSDARSCRLQRNLIQKVEQRVLHEFQALVQSRMGDSTIIGAAAYLVFAASKGHGLGAAGSIDTSGVTEQCRNKQEFQRHLWDLFMPSICRTVADSHGALARSVAVTRRPDLRVRRSKK